MSYKSGESVIITKEGTNCVGVILDSYIINKVLMYDVLLETRSAIIMVNTQSSCRTYINKHLSSLLCKSGLIQTTIPYKELLDNDRLPIVKAD
jgi:hypothetical protein